MAQHRQAPSQFKEEPGHDSVSATFFHPASPNRKHGGVEKRPTGCLIRSPLPSMANIPHHHARIAGVPRSGPPAGAPDIDARRASSRPRSRLSVCLRGKRHRRRRPSGPSYHGDFFSSFPWTVCRVAASRARGVEVDDSGFGCSRRPTCLSQE